MRIRLIWVGKTKEPFISEGLRKYLRLLKPYAEVVVIEIKDEKGKDIRKMVEKEGERIQKLGLPYVLLDERGSNLSSVEFADFLKKKASNINFLVGGAFGVSEDVRNAAEHKMALSSMTFTHEMARLVLLEQVYRAFTIMQNRGYHH